MKRDLPDLADLWAVRSYLDQSSSLEGARHAFMHDRVFAVFETNYGGLDELLRPLRETPGVLREMLNQGTFRAWFASVDRALFNFTAAIDAVADHAKALSRRVPLDPQASNDLRSAAFQVAEFAFAAELRDFLLHSASAGMTAGYSVGTDEERSRVVLDLRAIQRVDGHEWGRNATRYFDAREAIGSDPTIEEWVLPAIEGARQWHRGMHELIRANYREAAEHDRPIIEAWNNAYPKNPLFVWESLVGCAVDQR
jgi:hypothetical protein